jgi:hypothetical protein
MGRRIKNLGEVGSPEFKRPTEAQKRQEFKESTRRTLSEFHIPALPTFDIDVTDNAYRDDAVGIAGVRNPANVPATVNQPEFQPCECLAR